MLNVKEIQENIIKILEVYKTRKVDVLVHLKNEEYDKFNDSCRLQNIAFSNFQSLEHLANENNINLKKNKKYIEIIDEVLHIQAQIDEISEIKKEISKNKLHKINTHNQAIKNYKTNVKSNKLTKFC